MAKKYLASAFAMLALAACGHNQKQRVQVNPQPGKDEPFGFRNACSNVSSLTADYKPNKRRSLVEFYHYTYDGVPVCGRYSASATHADGTAYTIGTDLARDEFNVEEGAAWTDPREVIDQVRESQGVDSSMTVQSSYRCWYLSKDRELIPAYKVSMANDLSGVTFVAGDHEVWEFGPDGLYAEATVSSLEQGNDQFPGVAVIEGMDDSGYLQSENFSVFNADGRDRAYSANGQFVYERGNEHFPEAVALSTTESALAWFRTIGATAVDTDCFPIDINMHVGFSNAQYRPATKTRSGRPQINVGDGDGINLHNVGTDPDVIFHEFSHHVVFRGVSNIDDRQSVIIHEGLSDFFANAHSGNACLGESLCPAGSSICWVDQQCLRTSDNNLSFTDEVVSSLPAHQISQILSGMLWDLRRDLGEEVVLPLVLHAIDFMLPTSTYVDLIRALMLADGDLSNGAHACAIKDAADGRGLADQLRLEDCQSYIHE